MDLLPNYTEAFIDLNKLRDYCLSQYHPIGKYKAKVFKSVLNIDHSDASLLKDIILQELHYSSAELGKVDNYGTRYTVDMKIINLGNEATIRTG